VVFADFMVVLLCSDLRAEPTWQTDIDSFSRTDATLGSLGFYLGNRKWGAKDDTLEEIISS